MADVDLIDAATPVAAAAGEDDVSAKEEELCQLVINVLFTVMWRGRAGVSEDVIKDRGQVIACINMLGLNNELFTSHVDLKRRIVELSVQVRNMS